MKNSYFPMYNEHFMETTERMSEISGLKIAGYSEFDNARIVFSHLKNTLEDFRIGGNKIDDYLLLGSSFDGRYPFFIGTTTNLLRCKNQFSRISKLEKVRHTKSAPKKREELLKSLEIYFADRQKMYNDFNRMLEYRIDDKIKEEAIDYILSISQEDRLEENVSTRKLNQVEMLRLAMGTEMSDLGSNLWGMFNGVTKYTTHDLNVDKTFGNIFGTTAKLNHNAFSFATRQLEFA